MGSSASMNSQLNGQLSFLKKYFEIIALSTGQKYLDIIRERENIRTIELFMSRDINIFSDIKSLLKLIKIFYIEKPDIVHGSSPKGALLSMLASYICRVPNRVYTVTGLRFETTQGWLRKLLIFIEKINCFCATKVIPEGSGVKKTLIANRITKKPLNIILNGNINGINTTYFSPTEVKESKEFIRENLGISKNMFVFIFIGRLVKDKGVNELIAAFNKLNNERKCSLILLGDLEDINVISEESKFEILNNSSIKYLGYKEDIRPYLKASDVFVFPSYREGFPNVVLQASSMELPSIVTDISGSNEIINNETGLIIPKEDKDSLYEAMKLFMRELSSEQLKIMGKQARKDVKEKFEQEKVWEALLVEYKKMLL